MKTLYKALEEYYIVILIVLASKILIIFFLSWLSAYILSTSRAINLNIWELWNVWDAPHYVSIATSGYQIRGVDAYFIVFLPMLPLLIFIARVIFQTNFLLAGYIVAFLASLLLAVTLYKLILLDYSKKIAILAVFYLFIFPTSFFLHIPYTESLFMFLCILSFLFVRKKYFFLSFIFAGFAGFTRLTGLALIPALLWEIYSSNLNKETKVLYMISGAIISASGFFLYLLINYWLWGNFFQFSIFEKQNWFTGFAPFGQGLVSSYQAISWRVGLEKLMLGYGQIIAFFFGLLISFYVLIKIRVSYGIYMLLVLWSSAAMSFWLSMPRYILSLFPMFIALALFSNNLIFKFVWILISIVLLIALGMIFIQYGPVF